jgi:hypothetical protein
MPTSDPDLHVVSLHYAIRPSEQVTYVNPQPKEFEREAARFRLADGTLTCEMKMHFSTAQAARDVVEPLLRAWEVDTYLRESRDELRFVFVGADVIDRSPCPQGEVRGVVVTTAPAVMCSGVGMVNVQVTSDQYPQPPPDTFRLNLDTESVLLRYQGYLDGREPLPAMAYFCLTVLGPRARAEKQYRISGRVLGKIARLTSEYGDRLTARKANAKRPLSGLERSWLEAAVKMLIWRLGDTRDTALLELITMADLPSL